ncbi:MAG TPA: cytochrome c oxidase subunit 3 [Pseudolabrys sp.]|nr:cytochrome c oxidase subunit 3 [Pseudolabrys sp.]
MPEPQPAAQFAHLPQQHEVAQLGIWTFLATEVLFFGALLLSYAVYRSADPAAFAEAARHTKIAIGTINTAILLTSSFLVAWAVAVVKTGGSRFAAFLLWSAAALGLSFIGLKGVEYAMEYGEHLLPGFGFRYDGPASQSVALFFSFYIVATVIHAIHVAVGIAVFAVIGRRAYQHAYSGSYHSPVIVFGLYWHFVDIVWIFLFALIYLPGRSG